MPGSQIATVDSPTKPPESKQGQIKLEQLMYFTRQKASFYGPKWMGPSSVFINCRVCCELQWRDTLLYHE